VKASTPDALDGFSAGARMLSCAGAGGSEGDAMSGCWSSEFLQEKLWPILDRLGIPRCGLHAFRHTHSSLLVDMRAPVSVAQAQLRHEDPSVTLGIYSHVLGDSQREYAEKVAELLDYPGLQKHGPAQLIQ
jgi:hypothetical protein